MASSMMSRAWIHAGDAMLMATPGGAGVDEFAGFKDEEVAEGVND
jgi:hypothetical protein